MARRGGLTAAALISPRIWFGTTMRAALAEWDWATVLTLVTQESGVNQIQMAELTGFSQPHVSRLMKGQAQCYDIRAINRMIDGLGAPRIFAGLSPTTDGHGANVHLDLQRR